MGGETQEPENPEDVKEETKMEEGKTGEDMEKEPETQTGEASEDNAVEAQVEEPVEVEPIFFTIHSK